jgi:hypothetical protein
MSVGIKAFKIFSIMRTNANKTLPSTERGTKRKKNGEYKPGSHRLSSENLIWHT